MWICRECDTKNQDTDFYCACCGAKNPAPAAPRPARTPSQNDQRPAQPVQESGRPAQPAPAPKAQEAQAGAFPETFPARPKTKIPVVVILALIGVLFFAWKAYQANHGPETEYTKYSVKNDKVYVDVARIDPMTYHAWLSNEKEPTYVVCFCTRPDGSSFDMFITTSEYRRVFDKNISFERTGGFGKLGTAETLYFNPAIRIHGEVYDGSFLYGDDAAKHNVHTVLQYKSREK